MFVQIVKVVRTVITPESHHYTVQPVRLGIKIAGNPPAHCAHSGSWRPAGCDPEIPGYGTEINNQTVAFITIIKKQV